MLMPYHYGTLPIRYYLAKQVGSPMQTLSLIYR